MKVYVELNEAHTIDGKILCVHPRVTIEHSPRECFDHEKLRVLEAKLTEMVRNGLNDAMGGAK